MKKLIYASSALTLIWVVMFSFIQIDLSGNQVSYNHFSQKLVPPEPQDSLFIMFVSKDVDYDSIPLRHLKEAGYKIATSYPSPLNQIMIDSLNKADLIIIGRSSVSGDLAPSKIAWNHLTVPLLLMSQHSSAKDKLGWFNSTSMPHITTVADIKAYTSYKNDTIFHGVNFISGDTIAWAISPEDEVILTQPTNGTVMVRSDYLANAVNVVRFETGVPFFNSTCDKPYAPRTYFGTGLNTSGILNPFPLTAEGKKVWLAEINRLATTPYIAYSHASDATLSQLTIGIGNLAPAFNPDTIEYNAILPAGTSNVRIIATPAIECATLTGDGLIDVSSGIKSTEVKVTSEDGTTSISYHINFYITPTIVDNLESKIIQVIPNPAKSYVKVILNQDFTGADLKLINISGQELQKKTISGPEEILDVRNLKPGVYFIRIIKDNTLITGKVTLE